MFAMIRPARRFEELAERDAALALWPLHFGASSQSDQHRRQRRWIDDHAGVAFGEDRVILVLAVQGEALGAVFEQAFDVLVAEIPAAVALAEIAAEGAHVANLRSADHAGSSRQAGKDAAKNFVIGDGREF